MRPCHFATKADGLRYVCTLDHAHTGSHRLAWEHSREATAGASEVAPNPLPTWLDRLPARDVTPPSTDEERAVSAEMERDHRIADGWVNLDDPAVRERLADEFMDLRLDGPWVSAEGFTYQEAARLYADRFLAALRGSDEEGAG